MPVAHDYNEPFFMEGFEMDLFLKKIIFWFFIALLLIPVTVVSYKFNFFRSWEDLVKAYRDYFPNNAKNKPPKTMPIWEVQSKLSRAGIYVPFSNIHATGPLIELHGRVFGAEAYVVTTEIINIINNATEVHVISNEVRVPLKDNKLCLVILNTDSDGNLTQFNYQEYKKSITY